jgi:hypothetical protein
LPLVDDEESGQVRDEEACEVDSPCEVEAKLEVHKPLMAAMAGTMSELSTTKWIEKSIQ